MEIRIIGAFVSLDVSRIPSKYPDLTYVYLDLSRPPSTYPDFTLVPLDLSRFLLLESGGFEMYAFPIIF